MRTVALLVILIVTLIIGGFIGFFIGTHTIPIIGIQQTDLVPSPIISRPIVPSLSPSATPSAQPTPTSADVEVSIKQFYNWYISCVNQHFQNRSEKSVSEDCPYTNSPDAAKNLTTTLQPTSGVDPIFCSQNTPSSITVDKVIFPTLQTSKAAVSEKFGNSVKRITVMSTQSQKKWQVSNIICPQGS